MGISGFLTGLARTAGTAAPIVANIQAAKNQAAAQGLMEQRQAALQAFAMQMQQQALARQNALAQSTIGKNAAQGALARARIPGLLNPQTPLAYQTDKDGNIIGLPTRVSAGQSPTPVQTGVRGQPKPDPIAIHQANRLFDVQHPTPVPPTNVYLPSVDPQTGQTDYTVVQNRGPANPKDTHVIKPPAGSGGSGGSMAPVADMEQRYGEIAQAAQDLAAGKWRFNRAMQTREGLEYGIARENAGGEKVPLTQSLAAGAMDLTGIGHGQNYPKYQALMNSTRALGDDVAKVFKGRQNEEAVLREVALAELTPDDYQNPTVVQQKLSRLQHVIGLARAIMPAAAPTAAPNAPTAFNADAFYNSYTGKGKKP